jgi:hypothetical protein
MNVAQTSSTEPINFSAGNYQDPILFNSTCTSGIVWRKNSSGLDNIPLYVEPQEDQRRREKESTLRYLVGSNNHYNSILTSVSEDFQPQIHSRQPLFFKGYNSIKVPVKVERVLRRYVSTSSLREIHPDKEVAIEMCLVFLSNLSDTYFRMRGIGYDPDSYEIQGWKNLSSEVLRTQFAEPETYKKVAKVLIEGSSKLGAIIECDNWSIEGYKCYSYRLSQPYLSKGIVDYKFQTDYTIKLQQKKINNRLEECRKNIICNHLLLLYPRLKLPSIDQLLKEGKRLVKSNETNRKGKKYTLLGNKKKDYWQDSESRVFIEDHISLFQYLTSDGFLIPTAGGPASGERIVDSFTLCPKWIRKLITIDDEPISIVDFSCLHPNLAMSQYKGKSQYLTHLGVAEEIGIDKDEVKEEHISFFNKMESQMIKSKLYSHYSTKEAKMLENLLLDRALSHHGHKQTSRVLLSKEVQIMKGVFSELNEQNIIAGYVYDAVFCKESDSKKVKEIMDEVVLMNGVYTTAKIEE